MDEDLSIINANTRNEKIKNFFVKNKNKAPIVGNNIRDERIGKFII